MSYQADQVRSTKCFLKDLVACILILKSSLQCGSLVGGEVKELEESKVKVKPLTKRRNRGTVDCG